MPPKKRKLPTKRASAKSDLNLRAAIASGESVAEEVLAFRAKQRRKHPAVEKRTALTRRRAPAAVRRVPAKARALFGRRESVGVLIAEGDSWFDYPMNDVIRVLEDDYFYDTESVAHKGGCVEDMAHSEGQFEEFARRLEKLIRDDKVPRAILLSGGGNDIAGDEFAILINHARSTLPSINEDIVRGVIDVRLQEAYARIISGLTAIAKKYLGDAIPIITHGYDYPLPDGRGFWGGWWQLPGPWLQPGFQRKGHEDLAKNTTLIAELIDRFNTMLAAVSGIPEFTHVHYLDLRGTLKRDEDHWDNELHPSEMGFDMVTKKFAELIETLA